MHATMMAPSRCGYQPRLHRRELVSSSTSSSSSWRWTQSPCAVSSSSSSGSSSVMPGWRWTQSPCAVSSSSRSSSWSGRLKPAPTARPRRRRRRLARDADIAASAVRSAARSNSSSGLDTLIPPGAGEPATGPDCLLHHVRQLVCERLLALCARGVPAIGAEHHVLARRCTRWRRPLGRNRWRPRLDGPARRRNRRRGALPSRRGRPGSAALPRPCRPRRGPATARHRPVLVVAPASRATSRLTLALPASRCSSRNEACSGGRLSPAGEVSARSGCALTGVRGRMPRSSGSSWSSPIGSNHARSVADRQGTDAQPAGIVGALSGIDRLPLGDPPTASGRRSAARRWRRCHARPGRPLRPRRPELRRDPRVEAAAERPRPPRAGLRVRTTRSPGPTVRGSTPGWQGRDSPTTSSTSSAPPETGRSTTCWPSASPTSSLGRQRA